MINTINTFILLLLIILSIYFDLTEKRIPNFTTFPVIIWGLFIHTLSAGFLGFKFTALGFLVGLFIYLIPFILGGMGAGDVKLMAAIGALMGWQFILKTAIVAGLIGGLLVIIYLIYKGQLKNTLLKLLGIIMRPILFVLTVNFDNEAFEKAHQYFLNIETYKEKHYIPYGVAIGLGALIVFFV